MKLAVVANFPPTIIAHGLRVVLLAITISCTSINDGITNATAIMSTNASEAPNNVYNTGTFILFFFVVWICFTYMSIALQF